jgi:hypothetical protein
MPEPIVTFTTARFLWQESQPLRKWLWSRLPFARDAAKREVAENLLAALLEDSNKLARALAPDQADEAIDKRLEVFRADLIKAKVPQDEAETLVDRGALFVKLLVTGPMGETAALRERVGEMEKASQTLERAVETTFSTLPSKDQIHRMELHIHRLGTQLLVAWALAAVSGILAVVAIILALRASH